MDRRKLNESASDDTTFTIDLTPGLPVTHRLLQLPIEKETGKTPLNEFRVRS
jgi:hypothetical protein